MAGTKVAGGANLVNTLPRILLTLTVHSVRQLLCLSKIAGVSGNDRLRKGDRP